MDGWVVGFGGFGDCVAAFGLDGEVACGGFFGELAGRVGGAVLPGDWDEISGLGGGEGGGKGEAEVHWGRD